MILAQRLIFQNIVLADTRIPFYMHTLFLAQPRRALKDFIFSLECAYERAFIFIILSF